MLVGDANHTIGSNPTVLVDGDHNAGADEEIDHPPRLRPLRCGSTMGSPVMGKRTRSWTVAVIRSPAMVARPHVGTLREKPLHAALKRWYSETGDRIEEPVDGFVIDLVRGELLIEIQTRGFSSMKRKLATLLADHPVRLVYPIPQQKWIVKVDDAGGVVSRRKSPKRGSIVDLFAELVSVPHLIADPNLTVEVLLIHEEEVRRYDGTKAWRRKGWVVEERRLVDVVDQLVIDSPEALAMLLPGEVPEEFTTADLAVALGRHRRLAQQMTYCLRNAGVLEMVAKRGNAIVYRRTGRSGHLGRS